MASEDPTIIQPSDSLDGSASQPASVPAAPSNKPAYLNDGTEVTPTPGDRLPTVIDKTADQGSAERERASVRSSIDGSPATSADQPTAVSFDESAPTVPGYRPVKKLGEGTFGKVWLFESLHSHKRVAVKFFVRGTTQQWQLLQAEIMQLARLYGDPGIVQLQDLEPDANPPYCILTYAEGGSLSDRLSKGPMAVDEALRVFSEAAAALAYVHAKGIIHCDLKPGNLLLDARGKVLLADFGQAHLASDLTPSLGTFFYMAPEQADLAVSIPDTRWDTYALGALFFTMVTGRPPRDNQTLRDAIGETPELGDRLKMYREAVRSAPKPTEHRRLPGMDRRLAQIIDQCLEADPARRFRGGGSVVDALNRRVRARRQRPVLLFGLLAPLLLLAAGGIAAISTGLRALDEAKDALIRRQLEDDRVLAQLTASAVEPKIDYRLGLLERFAQQDEELGKLLARGPEGGVLLQSRVDLFRKDLDKQQPERNDPGWLFYEIFVADHDGRIVAEYPHDETFHRDRWAWRGWFHGGHDLHGQKDEAFPICRTNHVSQPYVYRGAAHNGESAPLVIALSVPIKAPGGDVVGRLVGLMKVEELHSWMKGVGLAEKAACVVLVDEDHHLIYHGLHNDEVYRRLPRGSDPEPLDKSLPVFQPLAAGQTSGMADHYVDPLDHQEYLAGFAPLKKRDWRVIVQHNRETTLQPSRDLARWIYQVGLVAGVVAAVFVLGLYVLLQQTLRRGEQLPHA